MAIIGTLPTTLTNGTTADATQVMGDFNKIVNDVNANAADVTLVALKASNNNFTAVQSGIAAGAAANFPIATQVQNVVFNTLSSTLGTNTITARVSALPLAAYAVGQVFTFIPSQTNTASATLAVDALASGVIYSGGAQLLGSELVQGVTAQVSVNSISGMPVLDLLGPLLNGDYRATRVFLATGTWVKPRGLKRIRVSVLGGGAAGGGSPATGAAQVSGGAGGAAGGMAIKTLEASAVTATVTVTIGTGGTGVSGAGGNNGGTTSFGSLLSATGGTGGTAAAAAASVSVTVPAGGIGTGGDLNPPGAPGGYTSASNAVSNFVIGVGASSPLGAGGIPAALGTIGGSATGNGAGGAGTAQGANGAAVTGGNGTDGAVWVEEFY
jgi:hypothetical protein